VHLLALLAVVGVPIGMMVGALGLQRLEQRLLGYPPPGDNAKAIPSSLPARRPGRRPSRPSESGRVPDAEPATAPILLPPLP
jgi:hypothetical protein